MFLTSDYKPISGPTRSQDSSQTKGPKTWSAEFTSHSNHITNQTATQFMAFSYSHCSVINQRWRWAWHWGTLLSQIPSITFEKDFYPRVCMSIDTYISILVLFISYNSLCVFCSHERKSSSSDQFNLLNKNTTKEKKTFAPIEFDMAENGML